MAKRNKKIDVQGTEVTIFSYEKDEYISLTDIARFKDSRRTDYIIQNWLRNKNTIEYLGIWERLNNPDFKPIEFDGFRKQAGLNSINIGLPILECPEAVDGIGEGDEVVVETAVGAIRNLTTSQSYQAVPFPDFLQRIIDRGGLLAYVEERLAQETT